MLRNRGRRGVLSDMPDHPLSEAYQKARKQYALFAGLLIAWELVGFDIKETEYFSVKSPQAAPFVLLALVAYFSGRTVLEWLHLDQESRKPKPSKIDFWSAHCIAGAGVGLYLIQRLLETQLADQFTGDTALVAYASALGLVVGFIPGLAWYLIRTETPVAPLGFSVMWAACVLISIIFREQLPALWFWPAVVVGLAPFALLGVLRRFVVFFDEL